MNILRSIVMAFCMFSRIPMPTVEWKNENMRYMLCAFPLVGAVIGLVLWLWQLLAAALGFGPLLWAAGLTLLPVAVTGGIHMDGFCDVSDALASHAPAEKKRAILKDSHTGAFAMNCVRAGAAHVTAVDISAAAIEQTKRNAALNGIGEDRLDFVTADVFELLTAMVNEKRSDYDMIILDPPAFTKSSATVKDAYRGYKDINYRAMRILPRGGYLATASCSHFMTRPLFEKMLDEAASDAGVSLRQIEARAAAPDHPYLRNVPETDYLKFYLFQVV